MKEQARATIPTPYGNFYMIAFSDDSDDWMPHIAMMHESCDTSQAVVTRIHSECITGDLFGSRRCDCGEQLDAALNQAAQKGGIVLYLRQEGRGIGIINKLKAYNLQDTGLDTIDANLHLGLAIDGRTYDTAINMLQTLGVKKIHLLTNNPEKLHAIEESPLIEVVSRIPLVIPAHEDNHGYLHTKAAKMGHLFDLKKLQTKE